MIDNRRAAAIAREANAMMGGTLAGGKLVYTRDGRGGEWYSGNTYKFGRDVVVIDLRGRRYTAGNIMEIFNGSTHDEDGDGTR